MGPDVEGGAGGGVVRVWLVTAAEPIPSDGVRPMRWSYRDEARRGDHICYISDLRKLRSHFPGWDVSRPLEATLEEMVRAEWDRTSKAERAAG